MKLDEREQFRQWTQSIGLSSETTEKLLEHMLNEEDMDPEFGSWIESPTRVMSANDPKNAFGLEQEPIALGFLIIGSCPNGDPVIVNTRDPKLPVFYLSHETLFDQPLHETMAKVSDSITEFDEALLSETSNIPLDYWQVPRV